MRNFGILSEIEENSEENNKKYKRIQSTQYQAMKENAALNKKNGKEQLEKAKKAKLNCNQKEELEYSKLAARELIDSTEKYLKTNAIMNGEENRNYYRTGETQKDKKRNRHPKKESIKKTHSFDILSKAPSNSALISGQEVRLLDQFSDKSNGFLSSHTALNYGTEHPSLEKVLEIDEVATKIAAKVEKNEERVIMQKKHQKSDTEILADNFIKKILDQK